MPVFSNQGEDGQVFEIKEHVAWEKLQKEISKRNEGKAKRERKREREREREKKLSEVF